MQLTVLSDEALVSQLAAICLDGHRLTARLVEHLIEVEERRLDLRAACTSMLDFCVRRLGMSEGAAFRRINAARLVKRFPALLADIESGRLHLSTLVLLRPHLHHSTEATAAELVAVVVGKTRREVEELLARRAPRPDVPSGMVELRRAPAQMEMGSGPRPLEAASAPVLAPLGVQPTRACIEPLSEFRFKVQLTASGELRAKLERARDLMSHANPSGDLAVVVERAVDLLLERLEKDRLGKRTRPTQPARRAQPAQVPQRQPTRRAQPRPTLLTQPTSSTPPGESTEPPATQPTQQSESTEPRPTERLHRARTAIPRAVRREVFARDGETCTFVDGEGRRCPSRVRLELDHVDARALGGSDDAANLRVRCRAHNRLHAEDVFGKEHVARAIDFRQRKSPRVIRVEPEPTSAAIDVALRGLVRLGFARADARRALDVVARRRSAPVETLPLQDLLRDAISALT